MVDHVDTLDFISRSSSLWPGPVRIFVKIDTGYHRSGITFNSSQLDQISSALTKLKLKDQISLVGLYSHLGHSYGFNTPTEAIQGLITEFSSLAKATQSIQEIHSPLVLSVGATPTATAAQNLFSELTSANFETKAVVEDLQTQLGDLKKQGLILELHAGVYPVLDMQQVSSDSSSVQNFAATFGSSILCARENS
jgi:D-serine ammonia-lyase